MAIGEVVLSEADRLQALAPETVKDGAPADTPADAPQSTAEGVQPAAQAAQTPDTETALAQLKADLEREREMRRVGEDARQAAEAEALRLRQAVQAGEISLRQANLIALSRAAEAAQAEMRSLQDQYAAALAEGRYQRAAETQAAMAEVAAKKIGFEGAKQRLEATPEAPPAAQDAAPDDLGRFTPRTREWLRAHPEVLRDPKKMALAQAAHFEAVGADIAPDTDTYFTIIERRLGYQADPTKSGAQRRPAASAPPAHAGGVRQPTAKLEVRDMTPRMIELAKQADMKPEEWLASYNSLLSEGKIERIN